MQNLANETSISTEEEEFSWTLPKNYVFSSSVSGTNLQVLETLEEPHVNTAGKLNIIAMPDSHQKFLKEHKLGCIKKNSVIL